MVFAAAADERRAGAVDDGAVDGDRFDVAARIDGRLDAIAFVHFRDIVGDASDFEETFHDAGQNDLPACIRAYQEVGFDGPMRPDHVPTMYGESNERPAYETLGRLFALGYIRGLIHSVYGKPKVAR